MEARSRARHRGSLVAATLAGALLLAPDDPRSLALTGALGLAGLCEALELSRRAHLTRRAQLVWALVLGALFGCAANAVALGSLVGLMQRFARFSWPVALAVSLLAWLAQAVPFALASVLAQLLRTRGHAMWVALSITLVPALALLPQLFPWHVAATQVGFLPFVQLAELGGESLLGVLLIAGVAAAHATTRARGRALLVPAGVAASCLLLPVGYGLLRVPQVERMRDAAPLLPVGVVQGNVGIAQKHSGKHGRAIHGDLLRMTRALEQRGAALTLWGETAYPYPLLRDLRRAPDDDRKLLGEGVRGPILLGLETYTAFDERSPKYNSAWLVRADGSFGERVDKARLLAFAEYVPLWRFLPPLRARFVSPGFEAGVPGVVTTDGGKLGVLICYEDLFASSARATVQLGARALVNLTNDAWFGDTREPHLHDLLARLRAVELRRDLVRTVNTGISSFTSASGAQLLRTRSFEQTSFVSPVRLLDVKTPYARWGDWVTPCCLLALAACMLRRPAAVQPATSDFTAS